jgi:hypothetical protein
LSVRPLDRYQRQARKATGCLDSGQIGGPRSDGGRDGARALDASSGVESAAGVKDQAKIAAFRAAAAAIAGATS